MKRLFETYVLSVNGSDEMTTREDILNAALGVFAECGFRVGTVRDICERAGANVAAVNYYFGDKASLYSEVIQHAYNVASSSEPMPALGSDASDPASHLRAWVSWYLRRNLQFERTDVGRLMAREMAEPSQALDRLAQRSIHPVFSELSRIVQAVSPMSLGERELKLHCISIIGQCLVYRSGSSMLERLGPPHFGFDDSAQIAEHVSHTAISALQHLTTEA
jgi:AcrR family transcriptional regulator